MRAVTIALALMVAAACGGARALEQFTAAPLTIETAGGPVALTVELADTQAQKAQGLMFRRSMPADHGMLFDYEDPRIISMWMKNTYLSLDMIFIGEDFRVVDIARETEPLSTRIITANARARAVLEVNAGMAAKWGVRIGDRVRAARFGDAMAR